VSPKRCHPARRPRRLLPRRSRPSPIPRARPGLAAQALLSRTPRPPAPTPTRSAWLHRHARRHRTGRHRTSRLNSRQPQPVYRRRSVGKRHVPEPGHQHGGFTGQPRRKAIAPLTRLIESSADQSKRRVCARNREQKAGRLVLRPGPQTVRSDQAGEQLRVRGEAVSRAPSTRSATKPRAVASR
jgi:hypothetical protein